MSHMLLKQLSVEATKFIAAKSSFHSNSQTFEKIRDGLSGFTGWAQQLISLRTTFILTMALVASARASNPSGIDLGPRCVLVNRQCQGGRGPENGYLLGYGFAEW